MVKTHHTTQPMKPGSAATVEVDHDDKVAIQYEFYIPQSIWSHSATRTFITRLGTLAPGATIFKGATGVWESETESVNIYRLILEGGKFDPNNTRAALHSEVGQLLARWSEWTGSAQKAFLFIETAISMTLSSKL